MLFLPHLHPHLFHRSTSELGWSQLAFSGLASLLQSLSIGGSALQVGAPVLSRVLARLPPGAKRDEVIVGLDAKDDAAVTRPPPLGSVMVHTVDFFRSFISDPYEFGAVAANNALGVRVFPSGSRATFRADGGQHASCPGCREKFLSLQKPI